MLLKVLNLFDFRKNVVQMAFLLCLNAGIVLTAHAKDDDKDSSQVKINDIKIEVFTYRPVNCKNPSIFFVFHGIERTAKKYRNRAIEIADKACLMVFAPKFDKKRFPNWRYQRGGVVHKDKVKKRSEWTASFVQELIDWAKREVKSKNPKVYLFGHSAGAQFLSRIAAYTPSLAVERIVIANPSTYVFPTLDESAPYGFGGLFSEFEAYKTIKAYLASPISIYLGQEDTDKKNLHNNKAAKRQGKNRLERGRNIFQQAKAFATKKAWTFNWKLVEVPNIGHSSKEMLRADQLYQALGLETSLQVPNSFLGTGTE